MIKVLIIEEIIGNKGLPITIYRGELSLSEEQKAEEIMGKYNNFFKSDDYFKNYKCILVKQKYQG